MAKVLTPFVCLAFLFPVVFFVNRYRLRKRKLSMVIAVGFLGWIAFCLHVAGFLPKMLALPTIMVSGVIGMLLARVVLDTLLHPPQD